MLVFKAKKSSVLSTILSSFYPEKIILVLSLKEKLFGRVFKGKYKRYSISLRNRSGKYDLGILMREFAKEME
ncbi:hypothetical protein [Candidatus Nanopusillus massiliensis]|uniref:hypothetical protein n=1 Tax=Candidatus Nanopusillus massiliensis TaxID=2897163 RepID=UPI001E577DD1|nr:hypothetical protein [Candidatus Nanopusillus massiliensis]